VLAFVAAAVLTPPDVISQIGLAVPTILLYEISILCVRFVEKNARLHADDEDETDLDNDEDARDEQPRKPGPAGSPAD
jgi:sec-independent protein translocase protein TatC